ncbi:MULTISPECIES: glycosyltransferase family 4 protein [unclassified Nostoc]|uniref:glycosyltransferase family 4 protein n=1 Tax=unclassified Nostoc TaxID=2593658 RepID=UPI002AD4676F|nr:glycosyltransferase family 4 protein [Nostoc sp. DedQUE03]MDZ7974718.1 glycosyltransferase family 4 protein [Nostoc sp. DedQUE03]MDZ8048031.1 glycosyltransferase family 4 protein [Nostoc sp. DedQUE02]
MKLKVFLICTGLGHVMRGYESFAEQAFQALSKEPSLDIILFKGGGKAKAKEVPLWNLPRYTTTACRIAKYTKSSSYLVEQISFFFSLIPHIQREKPDVIYFSDNEIGDFLAYWRRFTKQSYKLIFCNGGPLGAKSPIFANCDLIQQIAPQHLQNCLKAGIPAQKQTLLTLGAAIPAKLQILLPSEKEALRNKLGLPEKTPLILSGGYISKKHKRMDYLIREVASLPEPRPYLLLLGQQDGSSREIIELGNSLLGAENFQARTVASHEVANYYKIADAFVLASLHEGLGRVFLEAMSYGLPCIVHDYGVTRYIFDDEGYFGNFKHEGSLADLINQVLSKSEDKSRFYRRHNFIYERFSWDKLLSSYVEMIHMVAN